MTRSKFLVIVLLLLLLLSATACNNDDKITEPTNTGPNSADSSATEVPHTHSWVEATCKAPKTCSTCSATEGEALAHTLQDATCTEPKTCSVCGKTEGYALGHNWKEATCTTPKTCQNCNNIDGTPLNHKLSRRNNCIICGKGCSIKLSMSETDKKLAAAVQAAGLFVTACGNGYDISFALSQTETLNGLFKAPAILDITILNTKGETVYSKTKKIEAKDYQSIDGEPCASINISVNELSNISIPLEKVYVDIYNPGYFYFDGELSMNMPATIIMPDLPKEVYGNHSTIKVTNISFHPSSTFLPELHFSGEKTWDLKGNNYSRAGYISYKLYDSENYLICSSTCFTNPIAVGEKFRDKTEYITGGDLLPGYIYRLEILDTE